MNGIDLNLRKGRSSPSHRNTRYGADAPPGATLKTLVAATAFALLAFPTVRGAAAQSIGELDVRSRLGERFFGAVPVEGHRGPLDPRCVRVGPNPNAPAGADALQGVRIRIGNAGAADAVIIETGGGVSSPIVGFRLEVGCDTPVVRDFLVLAEPAAVPDNVAATPPVVAPVAPVRAPRAARAPAPRQAPRVAAAPAGDIPAPPVPARAERIPSATAIAPPAVTTPPAPPQLPAAAKATPPATAAVTQVPAPPASATAPVAGDADTAKRIAELRARSDDHAASLLALEDRLALLQKQAELLKAQLEYALANTAVQPSAQPVTAAAAPPAPAASSATEIKPAVSTAAAAVPPAAAPVRKDQGVLGLLSDWRVAAGGLTALLLGGMVVTLRRRASNRSAGEKAAPQFKPGATAPWASSPAAAMPPATAAGSIDEHQRTVEFRSPAAAGRAQQTDQWRAPANVPAAMGQTAEWVAPPTTDTLPLPAAPTAAADSRTATGPLAGSREFHITQQFQPVAERMVALSSPEEIVQQARTHYMDDGDVFKAIDLLEMAVAARKDSNRPWQALFAIYRRENMLERFQRLALAYRGAFGLDSSWPAVRALGRAIDPANPMYAAEPDDAELPEDLIERWLGVPLDFTAHLLANEMHDQLMDTFPGQRRKRKRSAGE